MVLSDLLRRVFGVRAVEQPHGLWTDGQLRDASQKLQRPIELPNPAISLDEYLTTLIAERDGVSPEAVTVDYIYKQRTRRFYPTTRYDISAEYGGYDTTCLTFLTQAEFNAIVQHVDAELARF